MKKLLIFLCVCLMLICLNCNSSPKGPVNVKANKEVVELVKSWDDTIWFFTSKRNPVKSLKGLTRKDIAFWGAEHLDRATKFFETAKIEPESKSVRFIGTGNQIFSGMKDAPRLFITWSNFKDHLEGAVRVILIAE